MTAMTAREQYTPGPAAGARVRKDGDKCVTIATDSRPVSWRGRGPNRSEYSSSHRANGSPALARLLSVNDKIQLEVQFKSRRTALSSGAER